MFSPDFNALLFIVWICGRQMRNKEKVSSLFKWFVFAEIVRMMAHDYDVKIEMFATNWFTYVTGTTDLTRSVCVWWFSFARFPLSNHRHLPVLIPCGICRFNRNIMRYVVFCTYFVIFHCAGERDEQKMWERKSAWIAQFEARPHESHSSHINW